MTGESITTFNNPTFWAGVSGLAAVVAVIAAFVTISQNRKSNHLLAQANDLYGQSLGVSNEQLKISKELAELEKKKLDNGKRDDLKNESIPLSVVDAIYIKTGSNIKGKLKIWSTLGTTNQWSYRFDACNKEEQSTIAPTHIAFITQFGSKNEALESSKDLYKIDLRD